VAALEEDAVQDRECAGVRGEQGAKLQRFKEAGRRGQYTSTLALS
jgi:hypothetical protein